MVFFCGIPALLTICMVASSKPQFDFSEERRRTRGCTLACSGFLCQHWLYCALLFPDLMVETHATISVFLRHKDMFAQLLYLFPVMVIVDRSAVVMTNVRCNLYNEVLGPS